MGIGSINIDVGSGKIAVGKKPEERKYKSRVELLPSLSDTDRVSLCLRKALYKHASFRCNQMQPEIVDAAGSSGKYSL